MAAHDSAYARTAVFDHPPDTELDFIHLERGKSGRGEEQLGGRFFPIGPAMLLLSSSFASLIEIFAPLFDSRVWSYAELLLVGAVLAPGKRTVTSVLRIVGLGSEKHFQNYHRVLNRARWSGRAASQILLGLLLRAFSPCGPILVGLDDTIERRWGKQIQARGIYRDPVRSSHSHFVKTSGLRWLSLMLLVDIPWAGRVWALPFLTVLTTCARG